MASAVLGDYPAHAQPSERRRAAARKTERGSVFQKTVMCKFNALGTCQRGAHCHFAHNVSELREKPNLYRTKMCKEYVATGRCRNPTCTFAHSRQEMRKAEIQAHMVAEAAPNNTTVVVRALVPVCVLAQPGSVDVRSALDSGTTSSPMPDKAAMACTSKLCPSDEWDRYSDSIDGMTEDTEVDSEDLPPISFTRGTTFDTEEAEDAPGGTATLRTWKVKNTFLELEDDRANEGLRRTLSEPALGELAK